MKVARHDMPGEFAKMIRPVRKGLIWGAVLVNRSGDRARLLIVHFRSGREGYLDDTVPCGTISLPS